MNPSQLLRTFLIPGILLASVSALASGEETLRSTFREAWSADYEEGQCSENQQRLAARVVSAGLSHSEDVVVEITNSGSSVMGLVNAEQTRNSNPGGRAYEQNWEYHVISIYGGKVFDLDFTNEPTVVSIRKYFEAMFLDESPNPSRPFMYVGRETKLQEYRLKVFPAAKYAEGRKHADGVDISLEEFLKTVP